MKTSTHIKGIILAAVLMAALSTSVLAQMGAGFGSGGGMGRWGPWVVSQGDPVAGQGIATQVCAACHGADGNSAQALFPNLAGQKETYLYGQLHKFANGERKNDTMHGMVATLDDQGMQNVAAYFSRQNAKPSPIGGDASLIRAGRQLFVEGDARRQVPACINCHGQGADRGRQVTFPRLGGQHAAYLEAQLRAMQDGTRDHALMMPMVAVRLNETDIKRVAAYLATTAD